MNQIQRITIRLRTVLARDEGASIVEYALLVALIAMVAIIAMRFFGGELSTAYSDIAETVVNS